MFSSQDYLTLLCNVKLISNLEYTNKRHILLISYPIQRENRYVFFFYKHNIYIDISPYTYISVFL